MEKLKEMMPNRRQFVVGAAATAALAASPAFAKMEHHHGGAKHQKLVEAAAHCVMNGEICMDHCIDSFKKNDTELAECMDRVKEAVEACELLVKYAAGNSSHLKKLASLCIDVCEDCAKECKKHAKKHPSCKACMNSCKDCVKACEKVA